ncbi:single-stranded DNA-binding protein [uncultured Deinococcus sp.]|uniref:single-stranded DNA-binding protein n=1 Tax=uncultured Deinococcus sp. TaxID=158789 RepID=UPI002582F881|nr:single-stranded DNA-binding protein [uncultured Deinococcus sp.]
MADLDRVRGALRASMTAWATLEVRGDQARVIPAPDLDTLAAHLEQADPTWGLTWGCDAASPYVVRALLSAGGVSRGGLGSGPTLHDARLAALADTARLYGVGAGGEGHWVEYDPEDGPNTADLDADLGEAELDGSGGPAPVARAAALPPEPPRDPQMDKARRHIEDLIEQLKAAGKSGAATRVLLRGYGETLEESRAIYKELQAILRG